MKIRLAITKMLRTRALRYANVPSLSVIYLTFSVPDLPSTRSTTNCLLTKNPSGGRYFNKKEITTQKNLQLTICVPPHPSNGATFYFYFHQAG
jgi:hypothetical protein